MRIDVRDAIAFAAMKAKRLYDTHHRPQFFKVRDSVNLRLHRDYMLPAIKNRKLGQQFVGPLRVVKRIG